MSEEEKYDVMDEVLVQAVIGDEDGLAESHNWLLNHGFWEIYSVDDDKTLVLNAYGENDWMTIAHSAGYERLFHYKNHSFSIHLHVIGVHPNYTYMTLIPQNDFKSESISRLQYTMRHRFGIIYDRVYKKRMGADEEEAVKHGITTCFKGKTAEIAVKRAVAFAIEVHKEMDKYREEHPECFNE